MYTSQGGMHVGACTRKEGGCVVTNKQTELSNWSLESHLSYIGDITLYIFIYLIHHPARGWSLHGGYLP